MPSKGLNVPIVTALDEAGNIIESDQRRVIRYTVQNGQGAGSIFLAGTTGEFNRLSNKQRQQLFEIGVDETKRINTELPEGAEPIEAWVGVTAETKAETLENIEYAHKIGADMGVIAPLTIDDLAPDEIVSFFENEVARAVGEDNPLPISLYDNPDIAAKPEVMGNMPVELIDKLRELPFVVCLKASTTREVLQNFMNAFSGENGKPALDIYYGNAPLIFVMDEMQREAEMTNRRVAGVVAGPANLFPREWREAWQAAVGGDEKLIDAYRTAFEDFEKLTFSENGQYVTSKMLSGIKYGLYFQGVISSPHIGKGTPEMTAGEAEKLKAGLEKVQEKLREIGNPQSLSVNA